MRSSCELLWEILILDKHISQENDTYNTHNNGHPLPIQHSACCMLFYRLLIVIRTSEGGAKIYALYLCALHFWATGLCIKQDQSFGFQTEHGLATPREGSWEAESFGLTDKQTKRCWLTPSPVAEAFAAIWATRKTRTCSYAKFRFCKSAIGAGSPFCSNFCLSFSISV